jgi:hypothetical protein
MISILMETITCNVVIRVHKSLLRHRSTLKNLISGQNKGEKIRGPQSHLLCLINGLKNLGVEYNVNPSSLNDLHKIVFVPMNIRSLEQAINLKKKGLITKLVAGPNIAVFPNDYKAISSSQIDYYLQSNNYYRDQWSKELPLLERKLKLFPAGVDIERWKPKNMIRESILLYYKSTKDDRLNEINKALYTEVKTYLEVKESDVILMKYGTHTQTEYIENLHKSKIMVLIGGLEGSPVSHVEAWSCNVPTFIHKVDSQIIMGKLVYGSSSPYLSKECGCFFASCDELKTLINQYDNRLISFNPRNAVINNLSDTIVTKNLLNELDIIKLFS